jgi:hypothetical protein
LELHADKTRLIEFGRTARADLQDTGEGNPENFDFLGFTHRGGTRKYGPLPSGGISNVGEWFGRVLNGASSRLT